MEKQIDIESCHLGHYQITETITCCKCGNVFDIIINYEHDTDYWEVKGEPVCPACGEDCNYG